jgi:hypothetical protein
MEIGQKIACPTCNQSFSRSDILARHVRSAHTRDEKFHCNSCSYSTTRRDTLNKHRKRKHDAGVTQLFETHQKQGRSSNSTDPTEPGPGPTPSVVPPNRAAAGSTRVDGVQREQNRLPKPDKAPSPPSPKVTGIPPSETDPSGQDEPNTYNEKLHLVLESNKERISNSIRRSRRVQDRYNFALSTGTTEELLSFATTIFHEQRHPFKLNISFGFVLENILTDQLTYFYASKNNMLFDKPILVKNMIDLQAISGVLDQHDILDYCRLQRPNTTFVVAIVTNALFYVDKLKKHMIGNCRSRQLPHFLSNSRSVIAFDKDSNGMSYQDNLCLFRCLAYHKEGTMRGITTRARLMMERHYLNVGRSPRGFKGVELDELPEIEQSLAINIDVYRLDHCDVDMEATADESAADRIAAFKVYSSRRKQACDTLNLNLWENHFSYIVKLATYCKRWSCRKCGKLFDRVSNLARHEPACTEQTKLVFPGGGYGPPKSVFDRLADSGIAVPQKLRYFPYRIAFDFEAVLIANCVDEAAEKKLKFLDELQPASVSVASNVPGFIPPRCFVSNGDAADLIGRMYEYLAAVSDMSYSLMKELFKSVLGQLSVRLGDLELARERLALAKQNNEQDKLLELEGEVFRKASFEHLSDELDKWLRRTVVLGFNSGKFDLNLIRQYLFPYFLQHGIEIQHIIKKNNDYLSVTTERLVFLDIKNYIAAGTSYRKWIESYKITQTKGFFPYRWFTNLEKLRHNNLPPKSEFWSELNQSGISDADYGYLQRTWQKEGFQSMKDLLVWYNNLDVVPFLEAAEKLHTPTGVIWDMTLLKAQPYHYQV